MPGPFTLFARRRGYWHRWGCDRACGVATFSGPDDALPGGKCPGRMAEMSRAGSEQLGLAYAPTTFWGDPRRKALMFSMLVSRIRRTASWLLKAMCGVSTTFSRR